MNPNQPTIKYIDGIKYKQCTMCLEWKLYLEDFSWRNSEHKQKQCKCKKCSNRYREELRKRNPLKEKDRNRNKKLKLKFGIDLIQYNKMKELQNGVCFICGCNTNYRDLHVDHNHETGQIRKLLCSACNVGLGMVKENYENLFKFIWYLYIHNNNMENLTFEQFIKEGYLNKIVDVFNNNYNKNFEISYTYIV